MVGTVLYASAYGLPGTYLTYVRYFGFFVSWYGWRALVGGMWHGTRGVDRLWWSMDQCNYNNSEHQFVWMFFYLTCFFWLFVMYAVMTWCFCLLSIFYVVISTPFCSLLLTFFFSFPFSSPHSIISLNPFCFCFLLSMYDMSAVFGSPFHFAYFLFSLGGGWVGVIST